MCCSSQSFPRVKVAKIFLSIGLVFTNSALFAQRAASDSASAVPAGGESLGSSIFWVGAALFACLAAAGGIILARKLHQQKTLVAVGAVSAPEPGKAFSLPNGNGSRALKLNGRPTKSKAQNNNHANGNSKRRRMFNYHKFYTEMVLQGPSPTSAAENNYNPYNAYGYNGYYVEYETPRINNNGNGHVNGNGNGNGNGYANGNGNGSSNGHENHSSEHSGESNGSLEARSSLIATQKSLIEEQARLIQEQARLIEEKSRLIAEKNQLLDRQSQMLDNNLL